MQIANEILNIRDRFTDSADARAKTLDRVAKLKGKCREVAEEAKKNLEAAGQKFSAMEADRDTWRARCRDAECKAGVEASRAVAAENQLVVTTRALESAGEAAKALESARGRIEELSERLRIAEGQATLAESRAQTAEERADTAWSQAKAAEEATAEANKRAREAGERAAEESKKARGAEERVAQLDELVGAVNGRAAKAEEEAREAEASRLLVAALLWDAQARFEEAESRAWLAEAAAKKAEEETKKKVQEYTQSSEFKEELLEAASDSYIQGFEDCKAKMILAYGLEDTDAIRPGDPDAPGPPGTGVGDDEEEEADAADGEEAGDTPQP